MKKIKIAGAGIGALSLASYLSGNEYEVEIFEKNSEPGGKIGERFRDGFRFDTGATILTMPEILTRFFSDINQKIDDYLDLIPLESSCKYFWSDGKIFNSFCERKKLNKELEEVFGEKEKNNFNSFINYSKLFYDLLRENFLRGDLKFRNNLSKKGILNFTKFISGKSINDLSNKFFKDKKLKQILNRFATYNGSSPYLAPQLFSVIPFVEYEFGSWYLRGGMKRLADAVYNICVKRGVKFNFNSYLSQIESNKKILSAFSVLNEINERSIVDFDYFVANFTNNEELIYDKYLDSEDWSCSNFVLNLGVSKNYELLSHNNILFSNDYEKEYIDIFEKKIPAEDMTIQISITSKIDASDAPHGCENWIVSVNVPIISGKFEWNEPSIKKYKEHVIDKIESFLYPIGAGLRDNIKFCEVFTPSDFKNKYNSEYGAIYGLSSNSLYTLMKRPPNRSKKFNNVFFTGGNTYPGGGIPLSILSGKIVSKLIGENKKS